MERLATSDSLAITLVEAIRSGDLPVLNRLLSEHPGLASVKVGDDKPGCMTRSLLHIATDWPGHYPNCVETIAILVAAGADVNARCTGAHRETPLHWAASADDVAAIDALIDAGADIDADGAVIAGGTPLTDAVTFAQWKAARRLVERGATPSFAEAAALGLLDRVQERFADVRPSQHVIDHAFWFACHGGQRDAAEYLLDRGANPNWLPSWEKLTPLDAARRNNFAAVAQWLRTRGGQSA